MDDASGVADDDGHSKPVDADSETIYETIVSAIDDAVFLIDVEREDGDYTFSFLRNNPSHREQTGLSEDELRGRTPQELFDDAQAAQVTRNYRQCVEQGEPIEYEETLALPAGKSHWKTTLTPIVDDGEVTGIVGTARNITDQRERERELRRIRQQMEFAMQTTNSVVYESNPVDESVRTYPPRNPILDSEITTVEEFLSYVHPDDRSAFEDTAIPNETDTSYELEYRLQTDDGTWWVLDRGERIDPEDGTEPIDIGVITDITKLKESERQLQQQRDNLEILNQIVRHDIRNDLQLVLAYAEMLHDSAADDDREYARQILEAGRDAVDITDTARDVTEVMLQSEADLAPIGLRMPLERQVDEVRMLHERAVITVEGPIPDVRVRADEMLGSVFRNLLTNAILHNDKEIPTVTVSTSVTDRAVRVRIADNGPGIPDELKEQIFEEGERGLESSGSGLGLYLVETLVDRYEGDVWVEDDDPEGSVFVVELVRSDY